MNLLDLTIDHLQYVSSNIDVVSFIFFLSTCKQLFHLRKALMRYHSDNEKYQQYDIVPLVHVILYSYIDFHGFRENSEIPARTSCADEGLVEAMIKQSNYEYNIGKKCKSMIQKLPPVVDISRVKNTLTIMGYHCFKNQHVKLYSNRVMVKMLPELCCKAVTRRFRYKYTRAYYKVEAQFYYEWHESCVNMLDLCEVAYHLKNRKYNRLHETLCNMQFVWVDFTQIHQTVDYLVRFANGESCIKHKAIIICIIYMYLRNDITEFKKSPKCTDKFMNVVLEKAYEHIEDIEHIRAFPKYLKDFMIDTIRNTAILMQN